MNKSETIKYLKNNIKRDNFVLMRRRILRPDNSGITSMGWVLCKDEKNIKESLNIEELKERTKKL